MGPGDKHPAAQFRSAAIGLMRTVLAHNLPRLAAALTYYTVLSLFPALVVVVALLGVVGLSPDALQSLLDAIGGLGVSWMTDFLSGVLSSILDSNSSSLVLGVGVVASLWAASSYVGAFMWASDQIYAIDQGRPYWRGLPLRVGLALLLLVLLTTAAAVVTLVGPFGEWVAKNTGLGTGALDVWSSIRWPILLAIGLLMFGLLYRFGPSKQQASWWRLLAGATTGVALWLVASAGFSVYLTHFASYNRVYGALGAAVAFLVWAWVMNVALLVGVEVNRSLKRPPKT